MRVGIGVGAAACRFWTVLDRVDDWVGRILFEISKVDIGYDGSLDDVLSSIVGYVNR